MADTTQAEGVADIVTTSEQEVNDPTIAGGEAENTNGEAVTQDGKGKTERNQDSKDTVMENHEDAKSNGNDDNGVDRPQSPDNKRKDTNDHYRNDNKRSRGSGDGRGRGRGRGGGRGGGTNWTRNNKNIVRNFDDQPESSDPSEIRRQVEFYFSDSNLPIDGYLLGLCKGSENVPVDLKTLHNFKRMRHFQPFSAVVEAVKQSEVLDVVEEDNNPKVTRKIPLDKKFGLKTAENKRLLTTDTMERSIYAKGFGEETKTTHLDIEEFFAPYGPINSIRLRRTDEGDFKGSIFVEFANVDMQQRFLELDPKPTWGPEGKELQIMSKQKYVDDKHQGILDGSVRPKSPRRTGYNGQGGGNSNRRGGRGGGFKDRRYSDKRDRSRSPGEDDWKSRRDRDQRNGNRGDRRGRGGGRGGRGRGGRDGRGRRDRDDEEEEERSRSRSPYRKGDDEMPTRAEAEAKKEAEANGAADAEAGAEKADAGSKKRAREAVDDGAENGGEVKKVKETEVGA